MTQNRKMPPVKAMAKTRSQHWQIIFCCSQANVSCVRPFGFWLKTLLLQVLWMAPLGPQSSSETTTRPTIHRTKSIKAPIMTMAGSNRRWAINQKTPNMKRIAMAPTVMKYGKYLLGNQR